MNKSRCRACLCICTAAVLITALLSAGCISVINPLPHEVMIRENVISVDPEYVSSSLIISLLANPNTYEPEMFAAVDSYLPQSSPVVEVGAGIGALSAYINDRLEVRNVDHIAVEANPYLFPGLNKTKEMNHLGTQFINAAVAYGGDTVNVDVSRNIFETSVSTTRDIESVTVPATTIDRLILTSSFPDKNNVTLVLDAGGLEQTIISNEKDLHDYVAVIITYVTPDGINTQSVFTQKVEALGYALKNEPALQEDGSAVMVFARV